jgi:hypothetical protein
LVRRLVGLQKLSGPGGEDENLAANWTPDILLFASHYTDEILLFMMLESWTENRSIFSVCWNNTFVWLCSYNLH